MLRSPVGQMVLLDADHLDATAVRPAGPLTERPGDERAARRSLASQVARLERDLADTLISAFPHGTLEEALAPTTPVARGPRVLALGELEALRDELAAKLRGARLHLEAIGLEQEGHRVRLERMLLEPGKHRFETVSNKQLGEGGCGVWQVRPRLGLIGMLAGWWHVKLSSGCPLATARRIGAGQPRSLRGADGQTQPQAHRDHRRATHP
jgi:hypothetical protein